MNREPSVGVRFARYSDGEFNYFEKVDCCDRCARPIEPGETFVFIELWSRTVAYGEVSLCSVQCEQKYPVGIWTSTPRILNAIAVTSPPKDSWLVLPSPPEYGGVIDWSEANNWGGKMGGEVRYRGRYARDPEAMVMSEEHKRLVMIETRDAEGLSFADFSDREKTLNIDLSEATTISDLDLVLNAKPIDAHNQLGDDEKKQIGGGL
jgi:hypothetical protein